MLNLESRASRRRHSSVPGREPDLSPASSPATALEVVENKGHSHSPVRRRAIRPGRKRTPQRALVLGSRAGVSLTGKSAIRNCMLVRSRNASIKLA